MDGTKEMNFQNVNLLNVRANLLSGNLLPMTTDSPFSIVWRIYSAITWLVQLTHTIGMIFGIILVPREKALKDGTLSVVIVMEMSFMSARLHSRTKLIEQVIQEMNNILQTTDDVDDIVKSTLKPIIVPFVIYMIAGVISVIVWTVQPVTLALEKSTFFYIDYNLPAALSPEPFSASVLIPSTIFMTIGSVYMFLKKFSLDVYMMHLVLMLTAQYRYTAIKLAALFRDSQDYSVESRKGCHPSSDQWMERELRALCRHQNTVLLMSFILKKLLSVNFSLLYVNNILRFCFIGLMISTIPSLTFMEGISVVSFSLGSAMQFFLLCSSVQTLLDASTKITDEAFNEDWFRFGQRTKHIFMLLIMANNLECRIAAVGKFNLSLPSFITIMNQSYSIALLFLRAK